MKPSRLIRSTSSRRALVGKLLTIDVLPPQVRQAIRDEVEGNPFYAEETIRMLLDNNLVARETAVGGLKRA